jgi:hypothetical protein
LTTSAKYARTNTSAPALLWALAAGGRGAAVRVVVVVEEGGVGFTDDAVGVGAVLVGAEAPVGLVVAGGAPAAGGVSLPPHPAKRAATASETATRVKTDLVTMPPTY